MLRKILQSLGMTVDTVDSGEAALEYLRDHKPDVIFMDHTMPGMDGLTALRRIQGDPTTAAIPVAMYTSKDEPAYRDEAHAAGAVDVLSKPATLEALGRILERVSTLLGPGAGPETVLSAANAAVTAEWVEKLVTEKSEQAFYDAVESQVLPLIHDVVTKLRREIEQVRETTPPPAETPQAPAQAAAVWQDQINPWLETRLTAFRQEERTTTESSVRAIAAEVSQNQLHSFTDQLVKPLSARFADEVHKASAAAHEAAIEAARTVAREAADQVLAEARPALEAATQAAAQETVREMAAQALAEVQPAPDAEEPLTLDTVRKTAQETAAQFLAKVQPDSDAAVREAARATAAQALAEARPALEAAAQAAAQETAREAAAQAVAEARPATADLGVMRDAWEADLKSMQRRIYVAAFWAAVAGVAAAALFHWLAP